LKVPASPLAPILLALRLSPPSTWPDARRARRGAFPGMLGKLYAEEFETSDPVWEASTARATGCKGPHALWPGARIAPSLFRFEMNLRESAVLGLVGVAGLGLWIENYRRAFDYRSVATMVLVTMLLVLAVDQVVFHARRRLK
jgi:phosphonate transport system permease protein